MKYALFLDYDGTLTPIVKKPSLAKMKNNQKKLLKKLALSSDIFLCIVTGRTLKNIKNLLYLPKTFYIATHGFEFFCPAHSIKKPFPEKKLKALILLKRKLRFLLSKFPKSLLEDKKWILTYHFRLVPRKNQKEFVKLFKSITRPFLKSKKIKLHEGKKIIELRPPTNWNKGKAVQYLIKKLKLKKYLPIYIGDDKTDEDAFKVLKNKGITIKVGKGKTLAKYRFGNAANVYSFLDKVLNHDKLIDIPVLRRH